MARRQFASVAPLRSAVFFLALPVLAEQFLSYFVGLVDTYLSGRLGAAETTAVGLAAYVSWLGSLLFGLVGTGTTAVVARAWGAEKYAVANRVMNQALCLAFFNGLAFLVFLMCCAPALVALLGLEGGTADVAVRYLRRDAIGLVATSVTLAASAALRGAGKMRVPMLVLGLVNILNMFFSIILTHGLGPWPSLGLPRLISAHGVDGIVWGTVIARTVGGVVMLLVLSREVSGLKLRIRQLRPNRRVAGRILRIGLPAAADGCIMWGGHLLFLRVISALQRGAAGDAIFAAHIVGIRVEAATYLPAVAFGTAAATLVGQNLGAGRPDRAKAAGHEAARQGTVPALFAMILFLVAAEPIYRFMHADPAVQIAGVPALRLLAFFQPLLVWQIVYVSALRGAGDTRWPLFMTIFSVLVVRLSLAYFCGIVLQGGLVGAWVGMCGDIVVRAIVSFSRFQWGNWRSTRV